MKDRERPAEIRDRREKGRELARRFREIGILAIYGQLKGHGFWIYPASEEMLEQYEKTGGWMSLDDAGPAILNDGKNCGNPAFHMFDDAVKLLDNMTLDIAQAQAPEVDPPTDLELDQMADYYLGGA